MQYILQNEISYSYCTDNYISWEGIVRLDGLGFESGMGKRFFSSPNHTDWLCGQPSHLHNAYRGSLLGVKQPGHDVDHSHHSSTQVKKEWSFLCAFMAWTG
jgi:hypothetical protein